MGLILFCPETGIGEGDIQDVSTGQSKIFLLLCKSRVLGSGIMEQLRAMSLELKKKTKTWVLDAVWCQENDFPSLSLSFLTHM